jgi:hypothetical protein
MNKSTARPDSCVDARPPWRTPWGRPWGVPFRSRRNGARCSLLAYPLDMSRHCAPRALLSGPLATISSQPLRASRQARCTLGSAVAGCRRGDCRHGTAPGRGLCAPAHSEPNPEARTGGGHRGRGWLRSRRAQFLMPREHAGRAAFGPGSRPRGRVATWPAKGRSGAAGRLSHPHPPGDASTIGSRGCPGHCRRRG